MSKPSPIQASLSADARLLGAGTRAMAEATTENLEAACGWQPMFAQPEEVADLTASVVEKLRTTDDVNNRHALTVWNQWAVARSFQIADNIGRMRGLLHLLRYWRGVQRADPDDAQACQGVLTVWAFARDHWGIVHPPTDPRLWDGYCESHVLAMARRKARGQGR